MTQKKAPTLSACMMVKNEEEMLPRCLNSIKHIVDEIIVVDTGSTDSTIEIAKSFGARIYHHPWEKDFSKHRNQSIGYVTCDWFLIIDADEELDAYHLTKSNIQAKLKKAPKILHCYLINLLDKDTQGKVTTVTKSARIFRNRVGVEYRGIVHNTAYYSGKVTEMDLNMFHYGYALSPEKMQAKYKRTSSLLLKRIDLDPKDYAAYFYLCQVYMQMKDPESAIKYAWQCLDILPTEEESGIDITFYYSLYHSITVSYTSQNRYADAEATARKGLALLPDEIDLYYDLACIGLFSQNFSLVLEGGKNYLRVLDEFRKSPLRAGTRFVFSTSNEIESTVKYWLMTAYIAFKRWDDALPMWHGTKEMLLQKPASQKELLQNLEKNEIEAEDILDEVTRYFSAHMDNLPADTQKRILGHRIFFLRKEENSEALETAITAYLELTQNYLDIPNETAIIIAEFLLKKKMGDFFLDITLSLFENALPGQFTVIGTPQALANGFEMISDKLPENEKGLFLSSLCLNIAWGLTEDIKYIESLTDIYNQQKKEE